MKKPSTRQRTKHKDQNLRRSSKNDRTTDQTKPDRNKTKQHQSKEHNTQRDLTTEKKTNKTERDKPNA